MMPPIAGMSDLPSGGTGGTLSARGHMYDPLRAQVPEDVKRKWQAAFTAFDLKQTNSIDAEELASVMRSMNMIPKPGEVEAMIAAVDHDGDSKVSYIEFEAMMVSARRERSHGVTIGFSHIVDRHIKMSDVAKLVTTECTNFVDRFCREHVQQYMDLPPEGTKAEQKPAWYDTFKQFTEEAELTMQNVLVLWGVAAQKNFDTDFLDSVENSSLLDGFLKLTDYEPFINRMRAYVEAEKTGLPVMDGDVPYNLPRPMTPHTRAKTQQRLAELDQELAKLDAQRNRLLAERRRLIGCEVEPVTTGCLKHELEARRWREDVGFD